MENLKFDVDYGKFKDNNNGAIVAVSVVTVTVIGFIGKYAIDAISK